MHWTHNTNAVRVILDLETYFLNLKRKYKIIIYNSYLSVTTKQKWFSFSGTPNNFSSTFLQGMCCLLMKFAIFTLVLVFQYEVSCEVICETEGCMTYEQMGSWYSFYFENEKYNKYAPCLQFGKTQDQFGKLKCVVS